MRTILVGSLLLATIAAPGCSRLARTAMRTGRSSYAYNSRREVKPEDIHISFTDLDAQSVKILNGHRAKWSELVQKYDATGVEGAAQVLAVLEGYTNAHWSEKPKVEDLAEPLGVAIGDTSNARGTSPGFWPRVTPSALSTQRARWPSRRSGSPRRGSRRTSTRSIN